MRTVISKSYANGDELYITAAHALVGARELVGEQLTGRARLFQALRRAHSWDEVLQLITSNGYNIASSGEDFFAADIRTGLAFSLWDCGHNRLVFEERLGHFPGIPSTDE